MRGATYDETAKKLLGLFVSKIQSCSAMQNEKGKIQCQTRRVEGKWRGRRTWLQMIQSVPAAINTLMASCWLCCEAYIRAVIPNCKHPQSVCESSPNQLVTATHNVGMVHISSCRHQQLRHFLVTFPRSPHQSRVSILHPSVSKSTRQPSPPVPSPILIISSNNQSLSHPISLINQPRIFIQHPPDLLQVSFFCCLDELSNFALHSSSTTPNLASCCFAVVLVLAQSGRSDRPIVISNLPIFFISAKFLSVQQKSHELSQVLR